MNKINKKEIKKASIENVGFSDGDYLEDVMYRNFIRGAEWMQKTLMKQEKKKEDFLNNTTFNDFVNRYYKSNAVFYDDVTLSEIVDLLMG